MKVGRTPGNTLFEVFCRDSVQPAAYCWEEVFPKQHSLSTTMTTKVVVWMDCLSFQFP